MLLKWSNLDIVLTQAWNQVVTILNARWWWSFVIFTLKMPPKTTVLYIYFTYHCNKRRRKYRKISHTLVLQSILTHCLTYFICLRNNANHWDALIISTCSTSLISLFLYKCILILCAVSTEHGHQRLRKICLVGA